MNWGYIETKEPRCLAPEKSIQCLEVKENEEDLEKETEKK